MCECMYVYCVVILSSSSVLPMIDFIIFHIGTRRDFDFMEKDSEFHCVMV